MLLAVLVGGLFAITRLNLGALASHYLSVRLDRKITIGALHLKLGNSLLVEVRGVSLANVKGGTQPEMVTLAYLKAEIAPWTILSGPMVVNRLSVDGAEILLEHGAQDRPNWRFGMHAPKLPKTQGRKLLPALLDGHFHNVAINYRTSGGNMLRTRLNDITVSAPAPDKPASLVGDGSYNGIALHADIQLPPFSIETKAPTLPVSFKLTSGTASLAFQGTATDPLDADGLDGRMTLDAPNPGELMALAGFARPIAVPLTLAGRFSRNDTLWRLAEGVGTLDGDMLKADLKMQEGAKHQPDAVTIDAGFGHLDIGAFAPAADPQPPGQMSLLVDPEPGVTVDAHIAAGHIRYRTIQGEDFDLKAKLAPGLLAVEQVAAKIAGGSAQSRVTVTRDGDKGVVDFDGSLDQVDAAGLARLMGWGPPPAGGPVSSRVGGNMTGATLAEARDANRIFAVLSMGNGTFDRKLVGMASTDIRSFLGGQKGLSQLSCLIAVLDLKDGIGSIAPLRIRTADGTIVGGGTYDARRDAIDVTIGTQRSTTSFFALDVPVRISGPLSNFAIKPALGASLGASAAGNPGALPPA